MATISIQLPNKYEEATIVAKIKDTAGTLIEEVELDNMGDSFFYTEYSPANLDAGTYVVSFVNEDTGSIIGAGELYWDGYEEITTETLGLIRKLLANNMKVEDNILTIYDTDGSTELAQYNLYDLDGEPTSDNIFRIDKNA